VAQLDRITANLNEVRQRIAAAAARSGRTADDVQLVAVTKYVVAEVSRLLIDAGCHHLGESRPQDLWRKADELTGHDVHWHLIGHLQRNKIRRTLPLVDCIHSIDRMQTLAAIDRIAGELNLQPRVLIEVNVSGDTSKDGLPPDETGKLLQQAGELAHVQIDGLMCMAALDGDADIARRNFADLRELRNRLRPACPPNARLDELSMGMSGDYEIAIEEGATIVRVGSALFEGIEP